ncbi:hypothetical protein JBE27_46275, partial [Streptomyces albiflaviniger]|nr:hypothetical protein [Streptomyces albiflaviniger]
MVTRLAGARSAEHLLVKRWQRVWRAGVLATALVLTSAGATALADEDGDGPATAPASSRPTADTRSWPGDRDDGPLASVRIRIGPG